MGVEGVLLCRWARGRGEVPVHVGVVLKGECVFFNTSLLNSLYMAQTVL